MMGEQEPYYRRLTQYLSLLPRRVPVLSSFVVLRFPEGYNLASTKKFEFNSTVYDHLGPLAYVRNRYRVFIPCHRKMYPGAGRGYM